MQPENGKWTGLFITQGGTTVSIVLNLTFADNSIEGHFIVTPLVKDTWVGPTQGRISGGTYSNQGDVHMEESANPAAGSATFDGVLSAGDGAQMIRGTVLITRGTHQQIGNLTVYSAESLAVGEALSAHVWGE